MRTLVDGVAMGSPQGPLMAIVFISSIEERLQDEGKMAQYCKHHVDDTLSIMPDVEITEAFPCTPKVRHPSVNSTMELAESGKLPFLRMEIVKHCTNSLFKFLLFVSFKILPLC